MTIAGYVLITSLALAGVFFTLRAIIALFASSVTDTKHIETLSKRYKMADGTHLTLQEIREERDRYLDALSELEDDHEMNKISEADKEELKRRYEQRALAMLTILEDIETQTPDAISFS